MKAIWYHAYLERTWLPLSWRIANIVSMDDRTTHGDERQDVSGKSFIAEVDARSSLDSSVWLGRSFAVWPLRVCISFLMCLPYYTRIWCEDCARGVGERWTQALRAWPTGIEAGIGYGSLSNKMAARVQTKSSLKLLGKMC